MQGINRLTVVVAACASGLLMAAATVRTAAQAPSRNPAPAVSAVPKTLSWRFPLPRPHTGLLLGNGVQGLMVWGKDRQLNITIGRAGFWDHRGGNAFTARTTYRQVKEKLEAKDEKGLRSLFEVPRKSVEQPGHPRQLGGGRLEIHLPAGWTLAEGTLLLPAAELRIAARNGAGAVQWLHIAQAVDNELAWVQLPSAWAGKAVVKLVPAWESPQVKAALTATGVAAPKSWATDGATGFTQFLPDDAPLTLAYRTAGNRVLVATELGPGKQTENDPAAGAASRARLASADIPAADQARRAWWKTYWADVPRIQLPDPVLQEIVDYGLYKQACTHPPQGLPAALQGPFMEDYQLPPWSNDYHFNINVQMMYTPALATNRLAHLAPLWAMLKAWMPQLQANGEQFFGRPGALMLPHAVDDRCAVVGTFWTGSIDHACTAWMAYLAWQHYQYGLDEAVLRETAWPLLVGAFEGYWAMLEEVDDGRGGKRFSLPVSVSPEFRGDQMAAWGRDASFQLAALHRIAAVLPAAAQKLGRPVDARWADVSRRLPPYTLFEGVWIDEWNARSRRIALWEGQDLIESHRHHSHLASIYPFATINPGQEPHRDIVKASLNRWVNRGMGMWSGWCVPWAATLHGRTGNTEAAVSLLHWWRDNFVNEGRGTLHNANKPGVGILSHPVWDKLPAGTPNTEIMQLDAGFGALSAVLELLVQHRDGTIHLFPDHPAGWQAARFDNVRTEGAFLVGATLAGGRLAEVRARSLRGGPLKLAHGLGDRYLLNGTPQAGAVLEKTCAAGEELILRPDNR